MLFAQNSQMETHFLCELLQKILEDAHFHVKILLECNSYMYSKM